MYELRAEHAHITHIIPMVIANPNFLPSYSQELFLVKKREKEWFEIFLEFTDEKEITSAIYYQFIKHLVEHNILDKSVILDVGCGDGFLSSSITNAYAAKENLIEYHCLEHDLERIESFKEKMLRNGVKFSATQGNCFDSDLDSMPYNADLIVASHIAYFTKDIGCFINSLIAHGNKNAILLLNHESSTSIPNLFRVTYNSTVKTKVTDTINGHSINHEAVKLIEGSMRAKIFFPKTIHQFMASILANPAMFMEGQLASGLYNDVCSNDKNVHQMKTLLEFVVQRPLETIANEGLLFSYLSELKKVLLVYNDTIPVASELQILIINDDFTEPVMDALAGAISSASDTY